MKIKNITKIFLEEFIYGGHLLSLGGAGIVWSVIILLDVSFSWQILLISYLIPQIIYTYNHFKESKEDILTNPERADYLQKKIRKFPYIISFYLLILFLVISFFANINIFFFVFLLVIGGLLYTVYFKKLTEKLLCFKNIYVSLFWALIISVPFLYYSLSFNSFFVLFFFFVFLRWIVNSIFFDIKDIKDDKGKKLKTLPAIIGKKKTLQFLHIVNFISFAPIFIGAYFKILPFFSLSLIIFYFYSYWYLMTTKEVEDKKIRLLSYIMVDGEYIFWPIVLIISKILI
ncbi:MAG: UbiA family prenyltransferase [Candidatus Pacebacteria bacterium]|nr:UbiA family prenyltransferase [Candidatus Paceibacterota bacterium]